MEVARASRANLWIAGGVALAVLGLLEATASVKVSFYLDAFERARLFYLMPVAAIAGLLLVIAYPRVPIHVIAFLLPFNFVGGIWGDHVIVLLAKVSMNLLVAVSVIASFVAPAEQRAWVTRTSIGLAVVAWLAAIVMACAVGALGDVNREFWIRESGWMFFFAAALPFGTMLRNRGDIDRLLGTICAGVAALQAYAFWTLVTGTRYTRTDVYEGVQSFFRAPYSSGSLFVMYLAAAALLYRASNRTLTRRAAVLLFAAVALLAGGLLASMVRSLWIAGAVGLMLVVYFAPRDRRTMRALAAVSGGAVLAVAVVAAIDRLSPESSGNWTGSAITFLQDLGSKESTSRVTREIEWAHAIDVWKTSPLVGVGFGYAYSQRGLDQVPEEVRPEPFYMHNSYLNILAKSGLAGLLAFLALIWAIARTAHGIVRRPDADTRDRVVATALLAGLIAVALLTTIMPVLTGGDAAAYLGLLAGLTVALQRSPHPVAA
jgi:O-antigen ligase